MENHTQGVTVCVRITSSGLALFRLKLKVTVVTGSKKVLARDIPWRLYVGVFGLLTWAKVAAAGREFCLFRDFPT